MIKLKTIAWDDDLPTTFLIDSENTSIIEILYLLMTSLITLELIRQRELIILKKFLLDENKQVKREKVLSIQDLLLSKMKFLLL